MNFIPFWRPAREKRDMKNDRRRQKAAMPHSSRAPAHGDRARCPKSRGIAPFLEVMPHKAVETGLGGWGARIRTWEWRNQNPLPYHLATPHRMNTYGKMAGGTNPRLPRPPNAYP